MTYEYIKNERKIISGDLLSAAGNKPSVITLLDGSKMPYFSLRSVLDTAPQDAYAKASELVQATRIE